MSQLTPDETILGLLAAEARHGYHLLAAFQDPSQLGHVWNLSTSQIYAVLKRLDQKGDIQGANIASGDAPTRTEYRLTESGLARLHTWLYEQQPSASIRRVRVEFLSRLYIARLLNQPTIPIVRQQKTVCQIEQQRVIAQRDCAPPGVGYLTLELVIAQLDAVLLWLDRCELVPKDTGEDEWE